MQRSRNDSPRGRITQLPASLSMTEVHSTHLLSRQMNSTTHSRAVNNGFHFRSKINTLFVNYKSSIIITASAADEHELWCKTKYEKSFKYETSWPNRTSLPTIALNLPSNCNNERIVYNWWLLYNSFVASPTKAPWIKQSLARSVPYKCIKYYVIFLITAANYTARLVAIMIRIAANKVLPARAWVHFQYSIQSQNFYALTFQQ